MSRASGQSPSVIVSIRKDILCSVGPTLRAEPRREHRTGADGSSALFDGYLNAMPRNNQAYYLPNAPRGFTSVTKVSSRSPAFANTSQQPDVGSEERRFESLSDSSMECWLPKPRLGHRPDVP